MSRWKAAAMSAAGAGAVGAVAALGTGASPVVAVVAAGLAGVLTLFRPADTSVEERAAKAVMRQRPVRPLNGAEPDGLDEFGGFSPHEFMLLHDEVYSEIHFARVRREAEEFQAQKAAALEEEFQVRAQLERNRLLESARFQLEGYRAELERAVAAEPDDELMLRYHAAEVRAAEGYVEWLGDAAPWQLVGRRDASGEYRRLTTPPDELRFQMRSHLLRPIEEELRARHEREEAVAAEVERQRIVAEAAERVGDESERFVVMNGAGEVVRVFEPKTVLGKMAARQQTRTGRARLQAVRDVEDVEDNGRLDGSVG